MKIVVFAGIVIAVVAFFAIFNVNFEKNSTLEFLEEFKTETGYTDYEAEMVYSTSDNEGGLRITLLGCSIDTNNMKQFAETSNEIALKTNQELNANKEFENIIVVFKPSNPDGIQINKMMSIDELKYTYKASDLK